MTFPEAKAELLEILKRLEGYYSEDAVALRKVLECLEGVEGAVKCVVENLDSKQEREAIRRLAAITQEKP